MKEKKRHWIVLFLSYTSLAIKHASCWTIPPTKTLTSTLLSPTLLHSKEDAEDEDFHLDTKTKYPPSALPLTHYQSEYRKSIQTPDKFWSSKSRHYLNWFQPPTSTSSGSIDEGDITWFQNGKLNVCYNCLDRHPAEKTALIYEGDEPGSGRSYTYGELVREVSRIANALLASGVQKGDVVTIYMGMTPYLMMTMLACARIGAVHSVVFAGFSADALASRITASGSRYLVGSRTGKRGGKTLNIGAVVRDAVSKVNGLQKVFFFDEFGAESVDEDEEFLEVSMNKLMEKQRPYCPSAVMDAEDPLFILYTSGSTGTPKGLLHTTAGYALYAAMTTHLTFGLEKDDIFACVADCGWVTGHSYVVYGPLLNGVTTTMFESTPVYPDPGRYWDLIQRHKVNIFYTAPTAIRLLMKYGDDIPGKYDLSSLRVLASVGEPINPEAWKWYYKVVGKEQCTVIDTYWQTETGGIILAPLAGITPTKPGSCTLPFYGIDPVVLDPKTGQEMEGNAVTGVLAVRRPWPGIARTCLNNHARYMSTYLTPYPGYYFTGDAVYRDREGYYWITGRVDDVLNVSGHRIGTADVEGALVNHEAVAQAAAVGYPHPVKGEGIVCFATLKSEFGSADTDVLKDELRKEVRSDIGPFASPDLIVLTDGLPMTRSGKIMRRILRKLVKGDDIQSLGDVTTLADPSVVTLLKEQIDEVRDALEM